MECLKMLAANEVLRELIVQNGCVSILCTFAIQDPRDLNIDMLKETIDTLLTL